MNRRSSQHELHSRRDLFASNILDEFDDRRIIAFGNFRATSAN
jgi:hypothetical protein